LAKSSTVVGQQRQNTGRCRWSEYVGWRRSQSQTNGVDANGRRRQVNSHLSSTTVPGHFDTGRPGQRSWTVLAVVWATSGDI